MSKKLIRIDNQSTPPVLTGFIYGHSKVGKTTLVGSTAEVEEMCPAVMIDCGTSSVSIQGEDRYEGLEVLRVMEFDGISEAHTWLSPGPKGGNALEEYGFKTIILDELDQLHYKALAKVMKRNVTVGDHFGKGRADVNDVQIQDFGEARSMVLNVVEGFLKFNTNLLVTSLVRIAEDALDKNKEYRMPSLAGQLRDDVPARMALYIYMDVQPATQNSEERRVAYFSTTRKFKAGVWGPARADRLGAEMDDPTMRKIYDAFVGKG